MSWPVAILIGWTGGSAVFVAITFAAHTWDELTKEARQRGSAPGRETQRR